jgi:hypothetical protein
VRIALKPVTNNPSTPETTAAKPSGGSFLDILSQGTQDAVQAAKGTGSHTQTQSDAHSSSQSSSDEQRSQDPSSSTASSTGTQIATKPVTSTSTQTTASADGATGSATDTQPTAAKQPVADTQNDQTAGSNSTQSDAAQKIANLLALANLLGKNTDAATATSTQVQPADSTTGEVTASGKQTNPTKGTLNKETGSASQDNGSLAQALALVQQAVTVPADATPAPAQTAMPLTQAVAPSSSTQAAVGALQTSEPVQAVSPSRVAAGQEETAKAQIAAADSALANAAQSTAEQDASQPANAQLSTPQTPHGAQQDARTIVGPAAVQGLQNDLAVAARTAATAMAAKATAPSSDGSVTAQASGQNAAQGAQPQIASTFLSAAIPQGDSVGGQTTGNTSTFKISTTNLGARMSVSSLTGNTQNATSGTSSTTSSAASTTGTSKNDSQDGSSSSSRDGQNGNSTAAGSQPDNALLMNAPVRPDATAAQTAFGAVAAAHTDTQSGSAAPTTASTSTEATPQHVGAAGGHAAEGANTPVAGGGISAINSARLIQNMNETEMRVGMRSTEFGDISIRTMVTQQQMQTQISVDHSELGSVLSSHIASVQTKLGTDYGLHASIEVSQGGASFSSDQGQSSQREYKPSTPAMQFELAGPATESDRPAMRPLPVVADGSRLDIRA